MAAGDDAGPPAASGGGIGATASKPARPRWARPLRFHLSVIIVILLLSICLPLMWLTYDNGRSEAIMAAEDKMTLLGQRAADRYAALYQEGHLAVSVASATRRLVAEPPEDASGKEIYMLRTLQGLPDLDAIYVGYPSGGFVQAINVRTNPAWHKAVESPDGTHYAIRTIVRQDGDAATSWRYLDGEGRPLGERTGAGAAFDPRRRPWYRAARGEGGLVTVGPYVSGTTGLLNVTIAAPAADDPEIVIGVDMMIETISSMLAEQAVSPNARSYVFDARERLVVHSDPTVMEHIEAQAAGGRSSEEPPADLDAALAAVRGLLDADGEAGARTVRFDVGDEGYLARIVPVERSFLGQGGRIVVAAPVSDFTEAAEQLLLHTLLVAAAFVAAGVAAAVLFSRRVSRALMELTLDARRIGDFEFAHRPRQHSRIAEINTLAGAMTSARNAIRSFALYVPRELVRRLVASGQTADGNAVRQDVTVLFTDIRDFTTISEVQTPETVVSLLSDYFEVVNGAVERHNGVIMQFLGDSIFAMWNAPEPNAAHVADGCRCALDMKAAVDAFNERCRQSGMPELPTRYGLHTGVAVVGNVGAETRRQYTAMGDTINVGSRLEGLNKQFATTILASAAVRAGAGPGFEFRSLGLVHAKGRMEQVEVFELVGVAEG